MPDALALALGFLLLSVGAEGLVRGSSALALRLGITPLVVGLTVVAFGTSSPELVVSVQAALAESGSIALGNVIGSNIANFALILGCTAVIRPVAIHLRLVRLDIPIVIGCSVLLGLLLLDGEVSRLEGLFLTVGIVSYVFFTIRQARSETAAQEEFADALPSPDTPLWLDLLFVVAGLGLLVGGANLLVDGAVGLAQTFNVSEAVIGLSIVAIGTSLPELATSTVAAMRGEGDLAAGNVVGSSIFNVLGILGPAALVSPLPAETIGWWSVAAMIGASLLMLPLMRTGFRLARWEGALLLALYAGYLYTLMP